MSLKSIVYKSAESIYKEKDFSFFMLNLSLFLLPLSINLSSFSLVISLLLKLVQTIFFQHKFYAKKSLKRSCYISFFFFCYIIVNSILQTDINHTLKVFSEEYSHFALLFLIPILLRNKHDNKLLSYSLIYGLLLAISIVLLRSFHLGINFDKIAFLKILNIHHTYLSIFILFSINFLFPTIPERNLPNIKQKIMFFVLVLSISFTMLFILGSKVAMVIYIIFILRYIFTYFFKKKSTKIFIILPILAVCFLFFNKKIDTSYKSALNFRLEIWKESVNSIKENPFFGNLEMNEKDVLNFNHFISGKYYLMDSDLNSHNQFLSIFLKFGIVGFIILSLILLNLLISKSANISKNTYQSLIGFCLIMMFTFYIENVLDRHHGIVFFSLFFNYYIVAASDEKL